MSVLSDLLMIAGAIVAALAGVGLVRFQTPYSRFHAAGKASPVAFLLVAAGAAAEIGWAGALGLAVVSGALILTLPVGVHLLFRSVHRTTPGNHLFRDDLADKEKQ